MKLTYSYSHDTKPFDNSQNQGIQSAPDLLKLAKEKGHDVELVDTSKMSDNERRGHYNHAIISAVTKKYEVRLMFGSHQRSGSFFGREVPALLVSNGNVVVDTFPHRKGNCVVTIQNFLTDLAKN